MESALSTKFLIAMDCFLSVHSEKKQSNNIISIIEHFRRVYSKAFFVYSLMCCLWKRDQALFPKFMH